MYSDLLHYFDLPILHSINGFCGNSWLADRLISHLSLDFKFAIPLTIFWMVWFQPAKDANELLRRRQTLLVVIMAVLLSLIVNRTISVLLPHRVRPMETAGIGYHLPLFEKGFNYSDFERWSSFPSDQTTYFFAFAAGFWLLSRPIGIAMTAYSTFIALSRIYLGTHFPSDVLVGALLGIAVQLLLNRALVRDATTPILAMEKRRPAVFNGVMFFVLLEMGTGFMNVRDVGRSLIHFVRDSGVG